MYSTVVAWIIWLDTDVTRTTSPRAAAGTILYCVGVVLGRE